jgi:vancomycin resistance protein YoaR
MVIFNNKIFKKVVKKIKPLLPFFKKVQIVFLALIAVLLVSFLSYNFYFWGKVYPGVYVAGIYVGGENPDAALNYLNGNIQIPQAITLTHEDQSFSVPLSDLDATYNLIESIQRAFQVTRTGNFFQDIWQRTRLVFIQERLGLSFKLDEQKLSDSLTLISKEIATEPVSPSVKSVKGEIVVDKGSPGSDIDTPSLKTRVEENLAHAYKSPIPIPLRTIDPTISDEEASLLHKRAESLVNKTLTLKFEYQTFTYKGNSLLALLSPQNKYNNEAIEEIVDSIAAQIERAPQEPVFVFEDGRVKEFEPAKDGVTLKKEELVNIISQDLATLESQEQNAIVLDIPTLNTPPKYRTGDVNNMGIKELIGRGVSRFRGSIPNRIHNIKLAASRFKGVIVPPGETFSFNGSLGDVSELTGFKQAYIIKDGKTVLGDGGGVCQVSTTLFRAALDAGLPIVARTAHAYRVGYYEQDSPPGFDATVYSPSPDLKIQNDTPGHILIQASVDSSTSTLAFEIYGTNDERVATTSKPVVTDQVAPPEDLYIDDPTLPAGTVQQIDYKAWGAKVSFNYVVTRNRETIYKKTFFSNYRPWQAVFLRGTAPAQ